MNPDHKQGAPASAGEHRGELAGRRIATTNPSWPQPPILGRRCRTHNIADIRASLERKFASAAIRQCDEETSALVTMALPHIKDPTLHFIAETMTRAGSDCTEYDQVILAKTMAVIDLIGELGGHVIEGLRQAYAPDGARSYNITAADLDDLRRLKELQEEVVEIVERTGVVV